VGWWGGRDDVEGCLVNIAVNFCRDRGFPA